MIITSTPQETYKISIPNWHPIPFELLYNTTWKRLQKLKIKDRKKFQEQINEQKTPQALGPRLIEVTLYGFKNCVITPPDEFNKSITELLTHSHLLLPDNANYFLEYLKVNYVRKGPKLTEVIIKDMYTINGVSKLNTKTYLKVCPKCRQENKQGYEMYNECFWCNYHV